MIYNDINAISNNYEIIYTDPPWQQSKGGIRNCRPNQDRKFDYDTMTIDEIKEYQKITDTHCADKYNVFMWTIDKYLFDTEKMMKELGYTLHARFIWDKENGVAPAFTVRFSHEYMLWFYKKGHILMPDKEARGKYTTVIREQSVKHSKKPIYVYEMLEDMFPKAKKLEMYARNDREGWDSFGNEIKEESKNGN